MDICLQLRAGTARGGFKPPRVRGAGGGGGAGGGMTGEDGEAAESPYSPSTLQLLGGTWGAALNASY